MKFYRTGFLSLIVCAILMLQIDWREIDIPTKRNTSSDMPRKFENASNNTSLNCKKRALLEMPQDGLKIDYLLSHL